MKRKIAFVLFSVCLVFLACNSSKNTTNKSNEADHDKAISDGHNSHNSIDWKGTYEGLLPCADCEGIETTITLNEDMTYNRTMAYLKNGKKDRFDEKGKFEWNADGLIITLFAGGEKFMYQVGENKLFALDMDGKRVTGSLADHYILKKK
ncbi:MAG: copper resistance protein NlpE N-terminal domain-containing protein [Saprospiraceae bacterium]|nr:copper resistance protein NlpE N-terminal domain-containing protein [Saprospiraceae bacterium]